MSQIILSGENIFLATRQKHSNGQFQRFSEIFRLFSQSFSTIWWIFLPISLYKLQESQCIWKVNFFFNSAKVIFFLRYSRHLQIQLLVPRVDTTKQYLSCFRNAVIFSENLGSENFRELKNSLLDLPVLIHVPTVDFFRKIRFIFWKTLLFLNNMCLENFRKFKSSR